VGVINKLKRKAIHDFDHLVKRLEKGYKIQYNDLMNIVCLIELYPDIKNSNYIASTLLHE
jgi:hypothetical protein